MSGGPRAGTLVEVLSEAEILATLDPRGRLDGMPFMPEMVRFCGQQLRVFKRADKTCDLMRTPNMRRLENSVLLSGARCDGSAHGGCQAGCLLFWKEAWLRPVDSRHPVAGSAVPSRRPAEGSSPQLTLADLLEREARLETDEGTVFSCQATQIGNATTPLETPWWDVRQYEADVRAGNVTAGHVATVTSRRILQALRRRALRAGVGRAVLGPLQRRVAARRQQPEPARAPAASPPGGKRARSLDLQPGDRVRIRGRREIEATLDHKHENRGLAFNPEMVRYCGTEATVLGHVERIINERTGKMIPLRDCVVLDGVTCMGDFHQFCPRDVYIYWREAWLTRSIAAAADDFLSPRALDRAQDDAPAGS